MVILISFLKIYILGFKVQSIFCLWDDLYIRILYILFNDDVENICVWILVFFVWCLCGELLVGFFFYSWFVVIVMKLFD